MEVDDTRSSTQAPAISSASTSTLPLRSSPRRNPVSPKRTTKFKRTSPKSIITSAGKDLPPSSRPSIRSQRLTATAARPLVPVTERKPLDEKSFARPSKETEAEKWDIAPDGGSAGREGRQFTVSNVGNNGRIYLKPVVRPAHQRNPQPNFTFPVTPPATAGLEAALSLKPDDTVVGSEIHLSQWSPTPQGSPRIDGQTQSHSAPLSSNPPTRYRRALSDSTIHEVNAARESDTGAFKIIISKPGEEKRPKTTEDANIEELPYLDINIPSWRIGVPRFTSTGTPLIRGSSYAPSEDVTSVGGGPFDPSGYDAHALPGLASRRPNSYRFPQSRISRSTQGRTNGFASPLGPKGSRMTFMSSRMIIDPTMFDELTFKPACDDRSMVRYAPSTGAVTAATPPRLVAEITSPSFLDYDLISDFFLTFRTFLEPDNLLRMLVARLRWAIQRADEIGMIVHVRTFVAMRHWILNYFMDDFVIDYSLRVLFCNLVNDLVDELAHDGRVWRVQSKTLGELKKCWRRVCAHYWDNIDVDDHAPPHTPIVPGGIAGHRDPNLDPSFWQQEAPETHLTSNLFSVPEAEAVTGGMASFFADVSQAGHLGDSIVVGQRPLTPEDQHANDLERDLGPASPGSLTSTDVVSCSFPGVHIRPMQPILGQAQGAHPAASSSLYSQTGQVATIPKALVGKRVRPNNPNHQRNDSQPDSLGEDSTEKIAIKDQEFIMANPHAGSLVRGNMFQPSQAFVDVSQADSGRGGQRQTTVFNEEGNNGIAFDKSADNSGMKRLISTVRRALSTRGHGPSPGLVNMVGNPAVDSSTSTAHRLPGTSIVPQNGLNQNGSRPPVRVDLLGAEVAEDFKKAVRETAVTEVENFDLAMQHGDSREDTTEAECSVPDSDSEPRQSKPQVQATRPASDMGLTVGSKSIVIVDGTVPLDGSVLAHMPLPVSPSIEAFAEQVLPSAANPTPPTTPPTHSGESARRSSLAINETVRNHFSQGHLPPFVPDLDTLQGHSSGASEDGHVDKRPMTVGTNKSLRHPPVSSGIARMHRRNKSSKTQQSLDSILRHHTVSFSSDWMQPSAVRSFDASTYTGCSVLYDEEEPAAPKPLRVLRRRPGGDLRAANNVDDLDRHVLRRSHSLGSLSAYTESVRDSNLHSLRRMSHDDLRSLASTHRREETFSVGQLADKQSKRELSLLSTRSSKPIMRPSFEAEAKKLAQIPDEEDDGIESALLKLEGKFKKRPPKLSMDLKRLDNLKPAADSQADETRTITEGDGSDADTEAPPSPPKRSPRHVSAVGTASVAGTNSPGYLDVKRSRLGRSFAGSRLEVVSQSRTEMQSFLSDTSRDSYNSTPLLDRALTDEARSKRATRDWADRSILQDSDDESPMEPGPQGLTSRNPLDSQHSSYELVEKTDSLNRIKPGETVPTYREQSFLDSDLSSEMSDEDDLDPRTPVQGEPISLKGGSLAAHSLGDPSLVLQKGQPTAVGMPYGEHLDIPNGEIRNERRDTLKPLPPTPEGTPGIPLGPNSPYDPIGNSNSPFVPQGITDASKQYSVHLPFILAFDSQTLAQQFTLIEKDALNEIDWKDLVDMDWKNIENHNWRSWVDFLRNTDAHGVEVVIARFNIVVKWAISEIVLTQNIEERAKCIIKYIHIASHCRRYRNFATLAQLTIALSSNEVSRLGRTWELVPSGDMRTLRELENLVTPMRNFYNIRAEMESGPNAGCIPFVGIYTHDLLYNGQRPSEIASSPTTVPLVNFERCRIGAGVVKTLLRLLEASTRYDFQPVEGITERCLWLGALSDEEIRRHSGNLE